MLAEQVAIESRLIELEGVESIRTKLRNTQIKGENDMSVDIPPEPPSSRIIEAKRKALAQYVGLVPGNPINNSMAPVTGTQWQHQ